jgi:DNA mismatch repair ATPase MutL
MQRLEPGVAGPLRAAPTVSSLWQAVEACVANACEAGAAEVRVELDICNLAFTVDDDGAGIAAADLALLGACGATSKGAGHRGEALAAIAAVGVIEVASRAAGAFATHAALLRGGARVAPGIAPEQRACPGTRVAARGLLWNRPVALRALRAGPGALAAEADRCCEAVARLALPRPRVAFAVVDAARGALLLRKPAGRSQEEEVARHFGRPPPGALARVATPPGARVSLRGWAAAPPFGHASRARQWLYVGGRFAHLPELADLVDAAFAELYAANARLVVDPAAPRQLQAPRRAANRHAMFVLALDPPPGEFELVHEPGGAAAVLRDAGGALAAVRAALMAAWRPALRVGVLDAADAAARRAAEAELAGVVSAAAAAPQPRRSAPARFAPARRPLASVVPSALPARSASWAGARRAASAAPSDARSGKAPRLEGGFDGGFADDEPPPPPLPPGVQAALDAAAAAAPAELAAWPRRRPTAWEAAAAQARAAAPRPRARARAGPSPLDDVLPSWRAAARPPDAGAPAGLLTLEAAEARAFAPLRPAALARPDLARARALRQVDAKFVPLVAAGGRYLLVLDQHAADERVRLEALQREVLACATRGAPRAPPPPLRLAAPQPLGLAGAEVALLAAHTAAAAAWGWRWAPAPGAAGAPGALVVTAVPVVLGAPLAAADLRAFLHRLGAAGGVAGAPPAVTRVLASRACRGAVMFGDALDRAQCGALAAALARAELCFACAHGRPTAAPLVDLRALAAAAARAQGGGAAPPAGGLKARLLRALA